LDSLDAYEWKAGFALPICNKIVGIIIFLLEKTARDLHGSAMFIRSESCIIGEFLEEDLVRTNPVQVIRVCWATRAFGTEGHAEHFNLQAFEIFADSFVLNSVVLISITVDHHYTLRIFSK